MSANTNNSTISGIYFLQPEGSAWIAARFSEGNLVGMAFEADLGTHKAAKDAWESIAPSETDMLVDDEDDCEYIVRAVMGDEVDVTMVIVSQMVVYTLEMRDGQTSETREFDKKPTCRECKELTEKIGKLPKFK